MTEREKMLASELYCGSDPELVQMRHSARRLMARYNKTEPDEVELRATLLDELLGSHGDNTFIEPDFCCDYGKHIFVGKDFYVNFGCVILDVCKVEIGDRVFLAPGVHIYTATHPLDHQQRGSGVEFGKPVRIGNDVWIGGQSIINPGVTIGNCVVIGSGSVVTKDVPDHVLIAGNPARIIKQLP